ncbi:MAG: hypothetical protein HQL06_17445 [Nitrospirae bacterium]|nr:hypothetical protein [Nitrospirota bacterium]
MAILRFKEIDPENLIDVFSKTRVSYVSIEIDDILREFYKRVKGYFEGLYNIPSIIMPLNRTDFWLNWESVGNVDHLRVFTQNSALPGRLYTGIYQLITPKIHYQDNSIIIARDTFHKIDLFALIIYLSHMPYNPDNKAFSSSFKSLHILSHLIMALIKSNNFIPIIYESKPGLYSFKVEPLQSADQIKNVINLYLQSFPRTIVFKNISPHQDLSVPLEILTYTLTNAVLQCNHNKDIQNSDTPLFTENDDDDGSINDIVNDIKAWNEILQLEGKLSMSLPSEQLKEKLNG